MMHWMLGILLVANVTLFVWGKTVGNPGNPGNLGSPGTFGPIDDVGDMQLLIDSDEAMQDMERITNQARANYN